MALTKTDISLIKEAVDGGFKVFEVKIEKKIDIKIDELARITAKGFESVDKRFEQVDKRFEQVDKRFERLEMNSNHMSATIDTIQQDIAEIKKHFVYRYEFEDVLARIALIEKQLGIKSGKELAA